VKAIRMARPATTERMRRVRVFIAPSRSGCS
jgi:hypothetical protein